MSCEEVQRMKKLPRIGLTLSCLVLLIVSGGLVSTSAVSDRFDVRVNGFVFEPGSVVALELRPAGGPPWFGSDVLVQELELVDASGRIVWSIVYDTFVYAPDWLGLVALRDVDGSELPPGSYEIRILTSDGTFTAGISIVPAVQFASLARFISGVPVCDCALRVHRAVTEADTGAQVTLRVGDRLMVLLAGNPTTGYVWSDPAIYDNDPLRATDAMEYRTTAPGRLGAGGFFFYRYWAIDEGTKVLAFDYARSWETIGPISTATFTVSVR
jgi:predicted secreted protein